MYFSLDLDHRLSLGGRIAPEQPDRVIPRRKSDIIERLVADRTQARAERDWARADQLRAELDARGVQVTDTPEGAVWQLR